MSTSGSVEEGELLGSKQKRAAFLWHFDQLFGVNRERKGGVTLLVYLEDMPRLSSIYEEMCMSQRGLVVRDINSIGIVE